MYYHILSYPFGKNQEPVWCAIYHHSTTGTRTAVRLDTPEPGQPERNGDGLQIAMTMGFNEETSSSFIMTIKCCNSNYVIESIAIKTPCCSVVLACSVYVVCPKWLNNFLGKMLITVPYMMYIWWHKLVFTNYISHNFIIPSPYWQIPPRKPWLKTIKNDTSLHFGVPSCGVWMIWGKGLYQT